MSISAINSISFKGDTKQAQTAQPVQQERKTGGAAPAIGSFIIPGLGHFMNGNNKTGFKFLGGQIGLGALTALSGYGSIVALETKNKALSILTSIGFFGSIIGSFALKIADTVKAYKGEQTKQSENKVDAQA